MAWTADQIDSKIEALELALDRHSLTVEYADRRVTYASTDEILKRIDYWQRKRDLLSTNVRPRQSYAVASKGFGWPD